VRRRRVREGDAPAEARGGGCPGGGEGWRQRAAAPSVE
jgi:hypothetical protein